jgi:hypothetical protein
MASSSIHCFAPNKSSCKRKSSSGALMASYSYRLPIFLSSKNSSTASVILSSLKRSTTFNRAPRSFLCCPPSPFLSCNLFYPLFEGKTLSLPCATPPKQVTARLFPSRVAPQTSVRLFLFYAHKMGPNESVTRRHLEEDCGLALGYFL